MISLKEIPKKNVWWLTETKHNAFIKFLSWFIYDKWVIMNDVKIYWDKSDYILEDEKVISPEIFSDYNSTEYRNIKLEFKDFFLQEFFWKNKLTFSLPIHNAKDHEQLKVKADTLTFVNHYLWCIAKERNIDDLIYNILKKVVKKIWVIYDVETKTVKFASFPKGKKYAHGMESWYSIEDKISLEDVLEAEIKQWYVNQSIWDKNRQFAYSHLLRAHAKFKLFEWSKSVLLNWKKYNVIAATRWQGKSYLAAKLVARELLNPKPWYGGRNYREIKYFVPNKEDIGNQVMDYIESMLWTLIDYKIPSNWKPAFEINRRWFMIKCNITWNLFKFVSLFSITRWNNSDLGTAAWEGIAADFAIIDEAARIPDAFWTSFHQRAAFETENFFIISTINEETPVDHWFYKLLIDAEQDDNEDMNGMRVTVDQNELLRQWKEEAEYTKILKRIKDTLRKWWDKEFYAKWYCIVLEESNVFDITWAIVNPSREKYKDTDVRVLWFDLWKLDDNCGVTLINIKHREVEESKKIKNMKYWDQLVLAWEYKKKFPNTIVIWDRSWVWEAVSEMDIKMVVDAWIKSTWTWDLNYNKKNWYYTCSKGKIINTLAWLFYKWILKIPADNIDLIEQLQNFVKMKSWRWETILYKGKWKKKDDLVLSCAYAALEIFLILWLVEIKDWEQYWNEFDNSEVYAYNDEQETSTWYYNWMY